MHVDDVWAPALSRGFFFSCRQGSVVGVLREEHRHQPHDHEAGTDQGTEPPALHGVGCDRALGKVARRVRGEAVGQGVADIHVVLELPRDHE